MACGVGRAGRGQFHSLPAVSRSRELEEREACSGQVLGPQGNPVVGKGAWKEGQEEATWVGEWGSGWSPIWVLALQAEPSCGHTESPCFQALCSPSSLTGVALIVPSRR